MRLRDAVSGRPFRLLLLAGVVTAATNLAANYAETGRLALVEAAVQVALVAVVGVLLVSYWNWAASRAEAD